jgi:hypothetical protein
MCASLEELQWGALFLFDHPKDANHNNVHLKGRIAVLLCALAFHCTSQRSSPLNCSNHDDLHLNGRIAVLLCALVFYCTNWRSSPLNCCSHDNMHLNGRVLFYIVHLCFTAQGEHHPHWIAAIMMMSASMEELQFYFVHLYFTAQGEDHTPLNCCNHDNVCFNTQELQFYFVHFCFTEQVIPHWIAAKRERIAAKKTKWELLLNPPQESSCDYSNLLANVLPSDMP